MRRKKKYLAWMLVMTMVLSAITPAAAQEADITTESTVSESVMEETNDGTDTAGSVPDTETAEETENITVETENTAVEAENNIEEVSGLNAAEDTTVTASETALVLDTADASETYTITVTPYDNLVYNYGSSIDLIESVEISPNPPEYARIEYYSVECYENYSWNTKKPKASQAQLYSIGVRLFDTQARKVLCSTSVSVKINPAALGGVTYKNQTFTNTSLDAVSFVELPGNAGGYEASYVTRFSDNAQSKKYCGTYTLVPKFSSGIDNYYIEPGQVKILKREN